MMGLKDFGGEWEWGGADTGSPTDKGDIKTWRKTEMTHFAEMGVYDYVRWEDVRHLPEAKLIDTVWVDDFNK